MYTAKVWFKYVPGGKPGVEVRAVLLRGKQQIDSAIRWYDEFTADAIDHIFKELEAMRRKHEALSLEVTAAATELRQKLLETKAYGDVEIQVEGF